MASNKLLMAQQNDPKPGPDKQKVSNQRCSRSGGKSLTPPDSPAVKVDRQELLRFKERQMADLTRREEERIILVDQEIERIIEGLIHSEVIAMCFNQWATHYDEEMEDHVKAILRLVEGLKRLQTLGYWHDNPFFGKRLIDFSIGTGAVEDGLPDILGPEFCKEMIIQGYDVSGEMAEIARQKLGGGRFSEGTINVKDMAGAQVKPTFDTSVLSQSLPFLPNVLAVMSKCMSALRYMGTLLVFDEDPQILSVGDRTSNIPKRILFGNRKYFVPVPFDHLRSVYLGQKARVEVLLKTSIDGRHDMNVLGARKVNGDLHSFLDRREAIDMLLDAILELQEVDPWASHPMIAGKIREFCPKTEIRRKKKKTASSFLRHHYNERTRGSEGSFSTVTEMTPTRIGKKKYGSYGQTKNTVIVNSVLRMLPLEEESYRPICRFVKPGGSLIVIDQWRQAADSIMSDHGEAIRRTDVENMLKRIGFETEAELWLPLNEVDSVGAMAFRKKGKD